VSPRCKSLVTVRGFALVVLTVLVLGVAGIAAGAPSGSFAKRGQVDYIVDGDTINVRLDSGQSTRVRLLGLDTPEQGSCFAVNATRLTRRLAAGRTVVLKGDRTQATRDRYGRLLAYVWLPHGKDLGFKLLAAGVAKVYIYDRPFSRLSAYRRAEAIGKSQPSSVWNRCGGPKPPPPPPRGNCDPSYPTVCIPPPPPDLDCADIPYRNFKVVGNDPHRFDGDHDGIGCEM
jgi:micrococcal nuclease